MVRVVVARRILRNSLEAEAVAERNPLKVEAVVYTHLRRVAGVACSRPGRT